MKLEVIDAHYRRGSRICDGKFSVNMSAHQCTESSTHVLYQPQRQDKHPADSIESHQDHLEYTALEIRVS